MLWNLKMTVIQVKVGAVVKNQENRLYELEKNVDHLYYYSAEDSKDTSKYPRELKKHTVTRT